MSNGNDSPYRPPTWGNLRNKPTVFAPDLAKVGTIYECDNFADFSDFTGSTTGFAVSGGKIVASTFNTNLILNKVSMLDKRKLTLRYTFKPMTGFGLYVGFNSANPGLTTLKLYGAASYTSGTVRAILYAEYPNLTLSGAGIAATTGDTIKIELVVDGAYAYCRVTNEATGTSSFISANDDFVYGASGVSSSTGRVIISNQAFESLDILSLKFESDLIYHPPRALVGDSISAGYFAGARQNRLGELLDAQIMAGSGDSTVELLLRLNDIITTVKPQKCYIMIGTNGSASYQADTQLIDQKLTAAGISPVWLVPPASGAGIPAIRDYLVAQFPTRVIDLYTVTKAASGTTLNTAYSSGDGVHMNAAGNLACYEAIRAKELTLETSPVTSYSLPTQTGNSGKYLTTNGTAESWGTVDLSAKADLASPALTGNPTAPTQTAGNNSTRIATTAFVAAGYVPRITSVDNRLTRFDGTTGAVQSTGITVDDSNNVTGVAAITASGNGSFASDVVAIGNATATGLGGSGIRFGNMGMVFDGNGVNLGNYFGSSLRYRVQAVSGQTQNIFEGASSAGSTVFAVSPAGNLTASGTGTFTGQISSSGNISAGGTLNAGSVTQILTNQNVNVVSRSGTELRHGQNSYWQSHVFYANDTVQFAVTASGSRIGSSGTAISSVLSATATLNFASIAASSFEDLTITVTGAASGDTVIINPIAGSATTDVVFTGWVNASNTVTIRASNVSATTARDPASGTFRATVIKF